MGGVVTVACSGSTVDGASSPLQGDALVPATANNIKQSAFQDHKEIQRVRFEDGAMMSTINSEAFKNCPKLRVVLLPAALEVIGDAAFMGCVQLESVSFASGSKLREIGSDAFMRCGSLEEFTAPVSLVSIGKKAFYDCASLTVRLTNCRMEAIGNEVFAGCGKIASLTLPAGIKLVGVRAFAGCVGLEKLVIGAQCSTIGERAFDGCGKLSRVEFPAVLEVIGDFAFGRCTQLGTIAFPVDSRLRELGVGAFQGAGALERISVPKGVLTLKKDVFKGCEGLQMATLYVPEPRHAWESTPVSAVTMKRVEAGAFAGCRRLERLVIPDSVQSIGVGALCDCEEVVAIEFKVVEAGVPPRLTFVWDLAFMNCRKLAQLHLPASLQRLGKGACFGCAKLGVVSFGGLRSRLEVIGPEAFFGCEELHALELPPGLLEIGDAACCGCWKLGSVCLPPHLREIGEGAFLDCRKLGSAVFLLEGGNHDLARIGAFAFWGCDTLAQVDLGPNRQKIQQGACAFPENCRW